MVRVYVMFMITQAAFIHLLLENAETNAHTRTSVNHFRLDANETALHASGSSGYSLTRGSENAILETKKLMVDGQTHRNKNRECIYKRRQQISYL